MYPLTELDEGPGGDLDLLEVLPVGPLGPLVALPLDRHGGVVPGQVGGLAEEGGHRDGRVVVGVRVHLADADGAVGQRRREVGGLDDEVRPRLHLLVVRCHGRFVAFGVSTQQRLKSV